MDINDVLSKLSGVKKAGAGYTAQCPAHEDNHNSLSINNGEKGILLHCHAGCSIERVAEALGVTKNELFYDKIPSNSPDWNNPEAEYIYTDKDGNPIHKTIRYGKQYIPSFGQKAYKDGKWVNGLEGIKSMLYNLPAVVKAVEQGTPILIVEGEKDADNLNKLGFTATTSPMGAGKWREHYREHLVGADVIIIPDNDDAGRKHLRIIAQSLKHTAQFVSWIDLASVWQDCPKKGDITDYIKAHSENLALITELIGGAEFWTEPAESSKIEFDFESITAETILLDPTFEFIFKQENSIERKRATAIVRGKAKGYRMTSEFDEVLKAYKESHDRARTEELKAVGAIPLWIDYQGNIDEVMFCAEFAKTTEIKCINDSFYSVDGAHSDNEIKSAIQNLIEPHVTQSVAHKTEALFKALKNATFALQPPIKENEIHLQNGVIYTDGTFSPQKEFCLNRLNVEYREQPEIPRRWLEFLIDLLNDDDILTLQEFFGYCLIPSTKAQKGLFLNGNGGEGKSVVGTVFKAIFGNSMVSGNLQELENNRFAMASVENKLVFLDDDMSTEALKDTKSIKKTVTAQTTQQVERKGVQQYDAVIYSRIIAFGNNILRALYDNSDGLL